MKRILGRSGIEVSAVGMGCWAIGGPWTIHGKPAGWGVVDDSESVRAIHRAFAEGIRFYDTAANYGCGHSERVLGTALAGRRGEVVIATKFGYAVDEAGKRVDYYEGGAGSPEVIRRLSADCEASLRRLGTDWIDLFLLHVAAYPVERIAPLVEELERLVEAGKIRCYGWSTDNPEGVSAIAAGPNCAAMQHNLRVTADAPEMLSECSRAALASVIRGPLARGALTGKFTEDSHFGADDQRASQAYRQDWLLPAVSQMGILRDILARDGRSLAQGALAWVLTRSGNTIPIPGIRTEAQAVENAGALRCGTLSSSCMDEIAHAVGLPGTSCR